MNEMKWIPVKERLPEKDGKYLLSYIGHEDIVMVDFTTDLLGLEDEEDGISTRFFEDKYRDKIISGEMSNSGFFSIEEDIYSHGEWYGDYVIFVYCDNENCAWIPLPEPYKED